VRPLRHQAVGERHAVDVGGDRGAADRGILVAGRGIGAPKNPPAEAQCFLDRPATSASLSPTRLRSGRR
jgi:hypothetical protein